MNSEAVAQLAPLADLFAEALDTTKPTSVAILGVAGGNGLERIDPTVTRRIDAIDINPEYLAAVQQRHATLPGLNLHSLDLAEEQAAMPPSDLVHAALIFEHAGLDHCLDNAIDLVAPGGTLSVVLQLPSTTAQAVGDSQVASVQAHRNHFHFVDPESLTTQLESRGFRRDRTTTIPLPSGKAFWQAFFKRNA
jgi:threonine dehydrogenase-like Zn-dependent dehydrogenase